MIIVSGIFSLFIALVEFIVTGIFSGQNPALDNILLVYTGLEVIGTFILITLGLKLGDNNRKILGIICMVLAVFLTVYGIILKISPTVYLYAAAYLPAVLLVPSGILCFVNGKTE